MVQVELEIQRDVCVVHVSGRIVAGADAEYLRSKSDEAKRSGCSRVLADFHEVSAIGSTGVAFIVGLFTSVMRLPNGRFMLTGLNHRVREVLDLTRVSAVIPIEENLEAALAALRKA
jgi:anti-anti-sigma factor